VLSCICVEFFVIIYSIIINAALILVRTETYGLESIILIIECSSDMKNDKLVDLVLVAISEVSNRFAFFPVSDLTLQTALFSLK